MIVWARTQQGWSQILGYCMTPSLHEMYSQTHSRVQCMLKHYLLSQPTYLHSFFDGFRSHDPCLYTETDAEISELQSPNLVILAAGIWQIFPRSEILLANKEPAYVKKKILSITHCCFTDQHKSVPWTYPHSCKFLCTLVILLSFYLCLAPHTDNSGKWFLVSLWNMQILKIEGS